MLEPVHLSQIAHELVKRDHIEIIPQLVQTEPLIYDIGQALRREAESN
jgi:hypothetical protein